MNEWFPLRNRLSGRHVIALAVLPRVNATAAGQISSPVLETEEAIAALVRAVIAEGGELTLVADESLGLFAGVVAGEYVEPFLEETREQPPSALSILIPGEGEADAEWMRRLHEIGYAEVKIVESEVRAMRQVGRTADALIFLGAASPDAVKVFREINEVRAPVFVLRATLDPDINVEDLGDIEMPDLIAEREAPLPEKNRDTDAESEVRLPPIALTMQLIVDRLIEHPTRRSL
jgi:hypothetical protein